jgi:cytochrome P450
MANISAEPSPIPQLIEEMLRDESPVQAIFRSSTSDTTIAGTPIAAGDKILIFYGSANRDDRHFLNSDVFDIGRNPQDHLDFGLGIHYCIGAPLARGKNRDGAPLSRFPHMRLHEYKREWIDYCYARSINAFPAFAIDGTSSA